MTTAANIVIGLVALLHAWFMVLEMFLWDRPYGRRVFRTSPEFATASKSLAANQGLYIGFLAAGLVWGLCLGATGMEVKLFFLACVIVAGVFGAVTVNRYILFIQAVPAVVAMVWVRTPFGTMFAPLKPTTLLPFGGA